VPFRRIRPLFEHQLKELLQSHRLRFPAKKTDHLRIYPSLPVTHQHQPTGLLIQQ